MTLSLIRIFFLLICGIVGYYVGVLIEMQQANIFVQGLPVLGLQVGVLFGLLLIFIERRMRAVSLRGLSSVVFGLLLGLLMAQIIIKVIKLLPLGGFIQSIVELVLVLMFAYLGAVTALRGKDEFNIIIPYIKFRRQDVREEVILVDTSTIIDGRLIDIYKTHFLSGRLVIPRSVLEELQRLADSENDTKRRRGRRGMEFVKTMQEHKEVDVHVHEDDLVQDSSVDNKLVMLAKMMDAAICTTDFNLSRVAELQGIVVLNLHDLAAAVKPVVYTGDELELELVKRGKEQGQAVGYLDDGTMVVVSDAKDCLGQKVTIRVTSVLQTQAGKMIFGDRLSS